jgi:hypothetical protein
VIHHHHKEKMMQITWLLGGLGLGAGLMYLLDPEQGEGRRDRVRGYVEDYGRQTSVFLDDTRQTLGRQAQEALATRHLPFRRQPELGERLRTQAEGLGLPLGLGLLGCIGLGVGLGYMLEPSGGAQRRAWLREKARTYWHATEGVLGSAVQNVIHLPEHQQREDAPTAHQV